jgi:hypothetical protein
MADKHPFHTITLFLLVVVSLLIIYGVFYLVLRNKK